MTQLVTCKLCDYSTVLANSKAIESLEGKITAVKVNLNAFNDKDPFKSSLGPDALPYTLVAKVPMSVAIKYC